MVAKRQRRARHHKSVFPGKDDPVFIIAEISANHGQDLNRALKLIRIAKECGADAVKFQTYTPGTITIDSNKRFFQIKHPVWGGQTLYQLYGKAYTPWSWFKRLKKEADAVGLVFFSAAFDKTAVDLLETIGTAFHKIASPEIVDLPLVECMARTGKPLILSTGMATISEIREAIHTAKLNGVHDIALLKCVSSYPADPCDMNLRTIAHMKNLFRLPIGLSDHTLGTAVSIAAVSLGAKIIEKHLTLDRAIKTPDSFFSLEPSEFKELVSSIRIAEKALGRIAYGPSKSETNSLAGRRSLFVVRDVKKGDLFTVENVKSIRPANGLSPKHYSRVLGRRANRSMSAGTPLTFFMLA